MRGLHSWMKTNNVCIPDAEQTAIQQLFADYLSKHRIALKSDFAAAVADKGIVMTDQRLSYHIRLAEYAGLLCSGDLFPLKNSYALVSDKLPDKQLLPRDEALTLLARKYFRSHGPATLEDFAWWCGLGLNDCRQGIASLGEELVKERWNDLDLIYHRNCRFRGYRSDCVHLLPPYDEYLIGYKSRHISLHPDHSHRAHNNTGNFWPVLLLGGEVIGNWSLSRGPGQKVKTTGRVAAVSPYVFTIDLFHPDIKPDRDSLDVEIARFNRFTQV